MNRTAWLFLGLFAALALSFWGLVLVPSLTLGRQSQVKVEATGALYPHKRGGDAARGAAVYQSLGCAECHSQQVRGSSSDIARGWGIRRTVAQDYVGDAPVLLGSQRIGPDLTNIGARKPNALEFYKHLWDPRSVTPGSMMPPYRFLFEKRRLKPGRPGSPQALPLAPADPSEEIVPTPDADALVAYLLSLHADQPLFEAPVPKPLAAAGGTNTPVTNAPAAATNAAGVTNAPAVVPGP